MSDETLNQSLDVRKDLVEFCVLLCRGVLLKCSRFLERIQIVQAFFIVYAKWMVFGIEIPVFVQSHNGKYNFLKILFMKEYPKI